ncbi:MAG: hypothetical protein ACC661_03375, partial [Verrucomicrobiales bacterium]
MVLVLCLVATVGEVVGHDYKGQDDRFYYDEVSRLLNGAMLEEQGYYEASAVRQGELTRVVMLEFDAGVGDRIVAGTLKPGGALADKHIVTSQAGQYRRPRLTVDGGGTLWLSYEALKDGGWGVFVRKAKEDFAFEGAESRVSGVGLSAINHDVAALPGGGLAVVWQGERG